MGVFSFNILFCNKRTLSMHRYEISDRDYQRLEPLLSGKPGDPGRNAHDNRRFINAVIWIARTGAPWADLPERFGKLGHRLQTLRPMGQKRPLEGHLRGPAGPRPGVAHAGHERGPGSPTRLRPKKSSAEAEALGRSRGGFSTKIHAVVDALGNPLALALTPGQAGDCPQAERLIEPYQSDEVRAVLADKGYDSQALVDRIESFEAEAVIPSRKTNKPQRQIDPELYKERNQVERFFNRIKHFRRVATRYEKTGRNYRAMLHLVSTMVLLL